MSTFLQDACKTCIKHLARDLQALAGPSKTSVRYLTRDLAILWQEFARSCKVQEFCM